MSAALEYLTLLHKLGVKPLKDVAQLGQFKFRIWMPTSSVNYSYPQPSIQI